MARLLTLLAALGAHPLTGTGTNKCYEELWSLSQLTVTVIADYRPEVILYLRKLYVCMYRVFIKYCVFP